jgi:hypothetical protein
MTDQGSEPRFLFAAKLTRSYFAIAINWFRVARAARDLSNPSFVTPEFSCFWANDFTRARRRCKNGFCFRPRAFEFLSRSTVSE